MSNFKEVDGGQGKGCRGAHPSDKQDLGWTCPAPASYVITGGSMGVSQAIGIPRNGWFISWKIP